MNATAESPRTLSSLLASIKQDLFSRANLTLASGAAAVAALGLAGGFDAAPPEITEMVVDSQQTYQVAPFEFEVEKVSPTKQGVEINVVATNSTKSPIDSLTISRMFTPPTDGDSSADSADGQVSTLDTMALDPDDAHPMALVTRDGGFFGGYLNPGVPSRLTITLPWSVVKPAGKDHDGSLPGVGVYSLTQRKSSLDSSTGYFDPQLKGFIPVDAEKSPADPAPLAATEQPGPAGEQS
ncbi:hypothetical protein [Corynebacterium aquilae]|uniref:Uncharacterized protein n=1 Tax=Corynebacterium aquilae DSM 44791 TaxID=1431546 RepID=A0A1L7CFA3_9CORY|nr:hypothetical protein [Corynebacterium aquilae]APT84541.1 hypothetical protein CAQU_05130 [Corynebacterium aquilae DSM 44791]